MTSAAVDVAHGHGRWSTLLVKAVAALVFVTAASLVLLMWLTPADLPLNFHPMAIRASAVVAPFGAVSWSA